jgi:S-DNA-T family DNA segregation ATPase FtsK/SpoIIIE
VLHYIKSFFSHYKIQVAILISSAFCITLSLVTYNPGDPSFNVLTSKYPDNLLRYFGSYISDILYQSFGLASYIIPLCLFSWSIFLYKNGELKWLWLKIIMMTLSIISLSAALTNSNVPISNSGRGGTIGILILPLASQYGLDPKLYLISLALVFFVLCMGIGFSCYKMSFAKLIDFCTGYFKHAKSININKSIKHSPARKVPSINSDEPDHSLDLEDNVVVDSAKSFASKFLSKKTDIKTDVKAEISLPPINLLKKSDNQNIKLETSSELKQNAVTLLNVLGDFGVKGQIIDCRQGPVVTLYEFEPAAGTKSSRIIGLSDDIARSLSAISTRIAVVSGRNVLGIELPNKQRAFFCLRELIETPEYQDKNIGLPLILGKDIAGRPLIADLAKMPHLLVAGTTGSGKSVAINTMIMSLLYRYTPEECRFIMIDPKMLELSAYDGIPHLLTPVVTEAGKAVVALKWAVKEMENRYRLMAALGVRNITSYNAKIMESINSGKTLERTVQTGFDSETGKPIYESSSISMEKIPFIVVIVDEMADLMLVAGKDIEISVQRLAQMARAAGIHIIMATQRPSVDVITGVIKANFPSRISFKVTSKIDSRTILGEQGAEQLLGMGDMLYMGNASSITRVHGPFVDDSEVEKITGYLRETGTPEYLQAVTEQTDDITSNSVESDDALDDSALYKRAVQIVQLERKVSISYIQRCLRIGYNRAANIIEKMEKEGVISPPSHTGKREILIDKS